MGSKKLEFNVKPGNYVLAVSGGVDSVALLDLIVSKIQDPRSKILLTVAHFDHGIRPDSASDADFVRDLAKKYELPFETARVELGPDASEATARLARYEFLFAVCKKHKAKLVTAHHQDDLLETAVINLLRGSGSRGLSGMLTNPSIERPLLQTKKAEIIAYAKVNKLQWREDSTNQSEAYLRNRLRKHTLSKLGAKRQELADLISRAGGLNQEIDQTIKALSVWLFGSGGQLNRQRFSLLDNDTSGYVVRAWLDDIGVKDINTKLIQRVVNSARTFKPGKRVTLDKTHHLLVTKTGLRIDEVAHV